MKNPLLTTVFLKAALFCAAHSGSISVISIGHCSDGSGLVDVYLNMSGDITRIWFYSLLKGDS